MAAEAISPDVRNIHFGHDGARFLRGMRNRLAHNYLHVDDDILWNTITIDLPLVRDRMMDDCQGASAVLLARRFEEDETQWLHSHLGAIRDAEVVAYHREKSS
ncbi:DUF86 domain-containing protein [Herbiconiux sp. P17]|uniref:HepT-like ribonuclease domain-containing protein n=1 Tax=Herbiconiux wuyangfengii TaxID=3342794 RepID=UPI0035B769B7